jgi:hypothetical protein
MTAPVSFAAFESCVGSGAKEEYPPITVAEHSLGRIYAPRPDALNGEWTRLFRVGLQTEPFFLCWPCSRARGCTRVVMSYLAFRKGRRLKIRHRLLALSTHHYQTTKLVSKLRRGGEIGETPADITAAIFFTFVAIHMRLYVLAGVEIIHSDSARQAAFRHSNLDYVRKV